MRKPTEGQQAGSAKAEETGSAKAEEAGSAKAEEATPLAERLLSVPALAAVAVVASIVVGIVAALLSSSQVSSASGAAEWVAVGVALVAVLATVAGGFVFEARDRAVRLRSEEIRVRVRSAEDGLAKAISDAIQADGAEERRLDEALLLSRVWQSVTARLEQYHDDAQSQGRRAFNAAMTAMSVGFLATIGCGAVAVFLATTNTAAVVIGSLGAVSAALSGFVARTYLRTYESVSGQLRGYFSQPVEASRYLSAERAIHVSGLPEDARRDLMKALVSAMVAPPTGGGPV